MIKEKVIETAGKIWRYLGQNGQANVSQLAASLKEKDEVVLSANIHNYLKNAKKVKAALELDGGCVEVIGDAAQGIEIPAGEEKRVDWRVKVIQPGNAVVRMKAVCDSDSDAMQMEFPVFIHGMLKMESFSGVIRPGKDSATVAVKVPTERLPEQTRLEAERVWLNASTQARAKPEHRSGHFSIFFGEDTVD